MGEPVSSLTPSGRVVVSDSATGRAGAEARTEIHPATAPPPPRKKPVQQAAPCGRTEGTGQGAGTERCEPSGAPADGPWAEQGNVASFSLCSTFSA